MKKFLQRFFILIMLFITIFTFTFKPRKVQAFAFALPAAVTVTEYLVSLAVSYLAGVEISNSIDSLEINKVTSGFVDSVLSVSDYDNWFYSTSNNLFYYNKGSNLYKLYFNNEDFTFSYVLVSDSFNILFSNWNDSSAYDDLYDVESNVIADKCTKDTKPPIRPEGNKYLISASVSKYIIDLCGALSDDMVIDDNGNKKGSIKVDSVVDFDDYHNTFSTSEPLDYHNKGCSDETAKSFSVPTFARIFLKDNSLCYKINITEKCYNSEIGKGLTLDLTPVSTFINVDSSTSSVKSTFTFSECSSASYLKLTEKCVYNSYYDCYRFNFALYLIDPMNNYSNILFYGNPACIDDQYKNLSSYSNTVDFKVSCDSSKFYVTDSSTFNSINFDSSNYQSDDYTVTVDPSQYNVNGDDVVSDEFINNVSDNVSVTDDDTGYSATVKGVSVENSNGETVSDGNSNTDTDDKSFLSKIIDFLKSILNAILGLPDLIAKAFEYLFEFVTDLLKNIVTIIQEILQCIIDLPMNIFNLFRDILNNLVDIVSGIAEDILNGLKELFIPDADYFSSRFDALQDKLKDKLSTDSYSAIFGTSFLDRDVDDMVFDLGFTTLVIKTSYYNRFKVMLKYVFMGIFFFLMCKYNYNQVYKIFRNTSEAEVSKYIGGGE